MLDAFDRPTTSKSNVQVFKTLQNAVSQNDQWDTWRKPRGVSMVSILAIAGGGGGGAGFTGIAASNRGGGGGGGAGGTVRFIGPAIILPDTLFVQVGAGGVGGVAGGAAAGGGFSTIVCLSPFVSDQNTLVFTNTGSPGGAGTVAAGGAAGSGASASNTSNMHISHIGMLLALAGPAGLAGGGPAVAGTASTIPVTGALCHGGAGGAGVTVTDLAGGAITPIPASYIGSEQRPKDTSASGSAGHGAGGTQLWKPFFSYCGLGGASSNAGVGANGGPGALGSGGGGGGGGTTGGRGGDGGSGVLVIIAW